SLSKNQKVKLMDSLVGTSTDKRGLSITYDLSHSGRRINNRIYTPKGQQDGISTLLKPYPKPILIHHDGESDPIGRFAFGEWQDISNESLGYFKDIKDFNEVQKAFDADDPERIYEAMKKNNLLTSKDWPGLGRMRVEARITDEKAIEKFLDGRYITFSAGSTTDRHVCSICQSDWAKGDICEHRHGKIYDGELCVFVTGTFQVLEGSVVNMPADDLSQVITMEFADMPEYSDKSLNEKDSVDRDAIYFSDSVYDIKERYMSDHVVAASESLVAEEHVSGENSSDDQLENSDAVNTAPVTEHSIKEEECSKEDLAECSEDVTKDEQVKVEECDSSDEEIPETVDSSEAVEDTSELLSNLLKQLSSIREELGSLREEPTTETKEEQDDSVSSEDKVQETEAEEAKTEEAQEEVVQVIGDFDSDSEVVVDYVDDQDIDWFTLDAALNSFVDEKLSSEARAKLSSSAFCGPDRLFPAHDCAYVSAARRLINRAKLSSDKKEKVLACIDRKAKDLDCNSDSNLYDLQKAYEDLREDYKVALQRIEELENKLVKALSFFKKDEDCKDQESLEKWFSDIVNRDSETTSREVPSVENPSVASSNTTESLDCDRLGKYEKTIVDNYRNILTNDGADAAERFLASKRRYLPRGFHPRKFIGD
ncbi:MAG: hypothetical protein CMF69_00180, partial [Magnetovibrio sp.]|nr:hypothetical protein [Magnetovibrio sp.]